MKKRGSGFTLVEILVVLAIIAILAALLFPAFNRARENAHQVTCQSNLQQIYFAVKLYYQDERRYPDSMLGILGEGMSYNSGGDTLTGATAPLGANAPGYYKGGQNALLCPDDDGAMDVARSSYGSIAGKSPSALPTTLVDTTNPSNSFGGDLSQYVWNYWGYRGNGFNYISESDVTTGSPAAPTSQFVTPGNAYNRSTNPIKYSMSNRYAPTSTIITHCIHHRLHTGDNLNSAGELYLDPNNDKNARDVVLKIDGTIKPVDVSSWYNAANPNGNLWQNQTP